MPPDPLASQDYIADRRYAYAMAAARDNDHAAAADVLEQAIEQAPGWAPAWFALGEARQKLGQDVPARVAFAQALALDPTDRMGAAARLARLAGTSPNALPRAYVARLFDDYAERFDAHLVDALAYRGPQILAQALWLVFGERRFARGLDIGCGTGLAGAQLRARINRLEGADLSPAMLQRARIAGNYDALELAEATHWLTAYPPASADLIIGADVMAYIGDLGPVLSAAGRALKPSGVLAFTVERGVGAAFALAQTLRYRHSSAYVEAEAARAGFALALRTGGATRREGGREAPGLVYVFSCGGVIGEGRHVMAQGPG